MTEQKKPEVGEWWFADDTGVRVYFCGRTAEGVLLYQDDSKQVEQDRVLIWHTWHHEPDCTGWDWEKPDWVTQDRVPARPGIDQRRWVVAANGACLTGDDWDDCTAMVESHPDGLRHGDVRSGYQLELRCLRKDLPPLPEVWPKYYETTVPGELAFLRRDTATVATYVLTDGKEDGAIVWCCADEWRKELTESEALSRIVKPAEPDYREALMSAANEFVAGFAEPQPTPLRIYMTVDGALYCDTKPRTPLHKQIQFSSCGCFVVEVGE